MKLLRSILSFTLALLVLFSASSFTLGIHLCCGEIQDVALFAKADGCEKKETLPACHTPKKVACCEDETIVHDGQGFKASVTQIDIAPSTSIDLEQPLVLISEIIPTAPSSRIQYHNYDPPLRSSDRTVSLQVFLI